MTRLSLHCECGLGFWLVLVVVGWFFGFRSVVCWVFVEDVNCVRS